jgi:hydroxymethylpyrimidine pyrophosphatase-like HAD family hydrolase
MTANLQYKGSSLQRVVSDLSIKTDEVLAIGDSENDIEFLSSSGVKVAVSNADEELKSIADYVTMQPHGDGVKEAVQRYIIDV